MMMFLFGMLMLIPLSFLNYFWLIQWFIFLLMFFFILNYSGFFQIFMVSYFSGVDILSYSLILLSLWICSLMVLASMKLYHNGDYHHSFMFVLIILLSLFLTFSSLNLFMFYMFFLN